MFDRSKKNSFFRKLGSRLPKPVRGHMKEILLRLVIFGSLPVICYFLLMEMRKAVVRMGQFQICSKNIRLEKAPQWAGAPVKDAILSCKLPGRFSILEEGISEKIVRAFEANPWIEKVVAVEKRFPNTVRLKLKLRRPMAFISSAGKYYLLDEKGVRLPGVYSEEARRSSGLPLIASIKRSVPEIGKVADNEAMIAGCGVAKVINDEKRRLRTQIDVIDVMNFGGRLRRGGAEITLVTADGARIKWGRSPGEFHPGELSAEKKIENLKAVRYTLALQGQPLSSKEYVDIRFDPPVVKERGTFVR